MGARIGIGVVTVLVGVVWILQGLDIRKGDGMSGHGEWAVIGSILVLFGGALLLGAWRMRADRSDD
jgi:hypothetical protein